MAKKTAALLSSLGIPARPKQLLSSCSLAVQQMVAIARAVDMDCKVLILDEPTSSLDEREVAMTVAGDLFLDRWYEIDEQLNEPSVETGLTAYQIVRKRSEAGAAGTVLNTLSELGVGTMCEGKMTGIVEGNEMQEENIMIGTTKSLTIEDSARLTREIMQAGKAKRDDVLYLAHGGPLATPADFAAFLRYLPEIDGFVGASSMFLTSCRWVWACACPAR